MAESKPQLRKYVVQSSDVISDMRVNVREEGSEKIVWYKERFLSDDEIVDHVVDNGSSQICWTIHKPKRGWYIRIRGPSFPPGLCIPLTAVPKASPYYTTAGLLFHCRTDVPENSPSVVSSTKSSMESDTTLTDQVSPQTIHSYPPTPTTSSSTPSSPRMPPSKLDGIGRIGRKRQTRVSPFLLAPHSHAHVPQPDQQPSLFGRVFSTLRNHTPSHSLSFTLSPIIPNPPHPPPTPTPLLTFHDRTPVLTVRSVTGLLELDESAERDLGVAQSFWIAIALTYLDFLEDRESYLAAASD